MDESTPYYEDDFNVFRLFSISMENKFTKWIKWFDKELIWKSADETRMVQEDFKFDSDDVENLHADIEEFRELERLIENTYSETDDEYNELQDEYIDMRLAIEEDILFLRDQIELIVEFLKRVHRRTLEYSSKWIAEKVDNT